MNLHGHMKSHHKPEFGQKSNKRNIKKSINLQKKKRAYNTRKFKCAECNFSCNHKYQIDYHGPYKHRICPICSCKVTGEYGESTNDIIHHVYEKHQQRFACLRCDKKFFSEAHRINHDYHSHRPGACIRDPKPKRLQSKDFKCRFCFYFQFIFKTSRILINIFSFQFKTNLYRFPKIWHFQRFACYC